MFPKEILKMNILPSLSIGQIEMIKSQEFYKSAEEYKKFNDIDEDEENCVLGSSINSFQAFESLEIFCDLSIFLKNTIKKLNSYFLRVWRVYRKVNFFRNSLR